MSKQALPTPYPLFYALPTHFHIFSSLGATCYALNNYHPDLPHCPHSRTRLSLLHWHLAGNV